MKKLVKQKLNEFFSYPLSESSKKISESNLKNVPELIQEYLKKTEILGKDKILRIRLKQKGEFKLKPGSKWKKFTAEQYINTENMSFLWYAKIKLIPLIKVYVIDEFIYGKGKLIAKLLSFIKIVDELGSEIDQGEFMRFLSESVWYPTFFCNNNIQFAVLKNNTIKIKLESQHQNISGKLILNNDGLIHKFTCERYYTNADKKELKKMTGYLSEYKIFNGIMLPTKFKVCWHLEEGDYCYINGNIIDIEFNIPKAY
jgi:hypothetical protein